MSFGLQFKKIFWLRNQQVEKTSDLPNDMTTRTVKFVLVQAAKKSGGDKYTCETNPEFSVYFPQIISRQAGEAVPEIEATFVIKSKVTKPKPKPKAKPEPEPEPEEEEEEE